MSTSAHNVPLLQLVSEETLTNDAHGRNAGQVAAVTTLSGATIPPVMQCVNFDGVNGKLSWNQGLANIRQTHKSEHGLIVEATAQVQETQQETTTMVRQNVGAMTYEGLLVSVLTDGEAVQASLAFEFTNFFVRTLTTKQSVAEPFYNGQLMITNKRLLAVSCSPAQVGTMTRNGAQGKDGTWHKDLMSYEIKHVQSDNIALKMWPLAAVRDTNMVISTRAESSRTLVSKPKGCCSCCTLRRWTVIRSQPVNAVAKILTISLENPSWSSNPSYQIEVNMAPIVTPSQVQSFVQKLQQLSPAAGGLEPMRR